MPRNAIAIMFLSGSLLFQTGCSQELHWSAVETLVESSFPDVDHISTDSLAKVLADSSSQNIVLYDTRTREEYEVSHIAGAIHLDPETTDFAFLESLDRATPIVTYCSVGYRSAEIADRLTKAGFKNAANVQGSIFRWANEGRPVVRSGVSVREVHPYDQVWGKLLKPELRAPVTAIAGD